jgi:colanic acid/amylovoran biosynthesis glycosyltransferase
LQGFISEDGRPLPKIGYVLKRFPRLSETFILNELLELERQGTSIEIFALLKPADELRHERLAGLHAPVTYLPSSSGFRKLRLREARYAHGSSAEQALADVFDDDKTRSHSTLALRAAAVAALAQARGVGHLHAHFATDATTVAMFASRLTRISYSFTAHAKDIYHEYVDAALLREKIAEAQFVVTVSDYSRQYLIEVGGEQAVDKIVRIYNGIDLDYFRRGDSVSPEPGLIVGVGRLVDKKGFQYLVEACRLLRDWGRLFRCLLIGDGPERASLDQQIRSLGLHDRVVLAGALSQDRLLAILKQATILVLPCVVSPTGDRDGLPTVLLEALALGLPAISTPVGGIPEIVEHGETGLLTPPGDALPLARAIDELLSNTELRERLARQGRSKAERCFDVRTNVAALSQLLAGRPSPEAILEPALQP